jgi:hypothetical protein
MSKHNRDRRKRNARNLGPAPSFENRPESPVKPELSSFSKAMLEVAAEDLLAAPCVVCGATASFVGVWFPTPECIARELGGEPTGFRRIVYRLCNACSGQQERDRSFVTTIENAILHLHRDGRVSRFQNA